MKGFWSKLFSWCSLPIFGLIVTANYLLGATYLLYDRIDQLETMPLNEIGDFLAGIFGALAFFWLVIGYFMQNSELRLNRRSLEQQIEEFKKSVATQKDTFEFNKELEALREERRLFLSQSRFTFSKLSYVEVEDPSYAFDGACEWVTLSMEMKNWGAKIFDVKFDLFNSTEKIDSNSSPSIEKNDSFFIHFTNEKIPHKTILIIKYTDSLSFPHQKNTP